MLVRFPLVQLNEIIWMRSQIGGGGAHAVHIVMLQKLKCYNKSPLLPSNGHNFFKIGGGNGNIAPHRIGYFGDSPFFGPKTSCFA